MNIKKNSKTSILIDCPQESAKIENLFYNQSVVSKIVLNEKTVEISKPGDYEYSRIGYTGFEVTDSEYKGAINIFKLVAEDVRVAVVFADQEINKDVLNDLANIDILITPFFNSTRLKEHIADIDPKVVIVLKDFEGSTEVNIEDMKKTLGVGTIEEASSYKFRSADFSSDGEYTLSTYILK